MEIEFIRQLQGYGFFFFVVFLVAILYGYCYHLIKSEKTGRRDYEKYGKLALNDEINDEKIEPISSNLQENLRRN